MTTLTHPLEFAWAISVGCVAFVEIVHVRRSAKIRRRRCYPQVVGRTCRVSFVDGKGTRHTAEVVADSLFEAALSGLKAISEGWGEEPDLGTAISVSIVPPEHIVTLRQIRTWIEKGSGTPKDMALRHRLKDLLPAG
jgi:hypothetical protein